MLEHKKQTPDNSIELLGELHPLLEQLGAADGLFCLHDASASLNLVDVTDKRTLRTFLETYREKVLLPLDLKAIHRAHEFACMNGCRELVALDQEMAENTVQKDFASASRRVGQSWIKRLRPLRGERLVQRYLQAVESGRAQGWHTIVFGITLAMYSLPVRQGLQTYARQTIRGFLTASAAPLKLSKDESVELFETICGDLPRRLEGFLRKTPITIK